MLKSVERRYRLNEEVIVIKNEDLFYGFVGKITSHLDHLSDEFYRVKIRTDKRSQSTFQYRTLKADEIISNSKICRYLYG